MVMHFWLWSAGCISQDTYLIYTRNGFYTWLQSKTSFSSSLTIGSKWTFRSCSDHWLPTGVSGNDIWEFGNGKGNGLFHSRSLGTGRELKKPIPSIGEQEGNEKKTISKIREWEGKKNLFPKFRNGKEIKKKHFQNSGMGREWKKSIPIIREREGNEKIPFP